MSISLRALIIAAWLVCVCASLARCHQGPDVTVEYYLCNPSVCGPDTDYRHNIYTILARVVNETPRHDCDYHTRSPGGNDVCYGHGACNCDLSGGECVKCLFYALGVIRQTCETSDGGLSVGAQVQLKDCRLRYEDYPFSE